MGIDYCGLVGWGGLVGSRGGRRAGGPAARIESGTRTSDYIGGAGVADDVGVVKYSVGGRVPALGVRGEGGICKERFPCWALERVRVCFRFVFACATSLCGFTRVGVIYLSCIGG